MGFCVLFTIMIIAAVAAQAVPSWYFTNLDDGDHLLLGKKSYSTIPPRGASMISGRGFAPGFFGRASLDMFMSKRAARKGSLAPRGATMVSGRGFGPGFFDSHNFLVRKRNGSLLEQGMEKNKCAQPTEQRPFVLKKWNALAMWSWDVECDTCAICRVHLMDACLRCQSENKQDECVVVWGECNHSFHNCCMALWVKQNNRCPLCQQDWQVQRTGH